MAEPIVKISEGKLRGLIGENICGKTIYKFLGIPYGKTPVGKLRFKAPQPADSWEGIKDATKDGDACYNKDTIHEHAETIQGGEDCLVLNVFTKNINETNDLKPVMVYIHGGGFMTGCNKSEIYGPEFLLTQDVVVVVVNYRLGLLGFLSLGDESLDVPGNAGLKDQLLALKWVQRNIRAFGGDPNNVTIFGESAGSGAVHFHVLSPASKGLFHKAILQSGDAISPWAITYTSGPVVAKTLDKEGITDKKLLELLQNMTGEEVFKIQQQIVNLTIVGQQPPYGPVVEKPNKSAFLTKHPFELIKSGEYNHVPLFIGYNSNEGLMLSLVRNSMPGFDDNYTYRAAIPWFLKASDEQLEQIEKPMSNYYSQIPTPGNKEMVYMDTMLFSTIVASIKHHVKTSQCPVYVYRVSVQCKRNFFIHIHSIQAPEGACHADELGFLWNIQSLPKIEQNSLESLTSQRFVKFWTNFAATGNPTPSNDFGVTLKPAEDENNITVLDIGKEVKILNDLPERDRVELWKKIFNLCSATKNYL